MMFNAPGFTFFFFSFFLFCYSSTAFSQNQECSCAIPFDYFVKKIELNYSGFQYKTKLKGVSKYQAHTAEFRNKIASLQADTACFRHLYEWSLWFEDKHVQLGNAMNANQTTDTTAIRNQYSNWEKINLSEAQVRSKLSTKTPDAIEGIWKASEGNYRVAIIKDNTGERDYVAFILDADGVFWMPGQVKFELFKKKEGFKADYYMRNHSLEKVDLGLDKGILSVTRLGHWKKEFPLTDEERAHIATAQKDNGLFAFKTLTETTAYLRMGTMNENYAKQVRTLISANKTTLENSKNLIIDVRGNGGGSDLTYAPIEKYLYTNRVTYDHMKTYCTKDNADKYWAIAKDKKFPWKWRVWAKRRAKKIMRNEGYFIGKDGTGYYKKHKQTIKPEQVVILMDGRCGSSCEQFVLYAMQSKKVTLMGENTSGVVDFGNLHRLSLPCSTWQMWYPTTLSTRVFKGKGIDNIGIPPKVALTKEQTDWVAEALDFLEKNSL